MALNRDVKKIPVVTDLLYFRKNRFRIKGFITEN